MFGNAKALLLVLGQRVLVLYLRLDGPSRGSPMFLIWFCDVLVVEPTFELVSILMCLQPAKKWECFCVSETGGLTPLKWGNLNRISVMSDPSCLDKFTWKTVCVGWVSNPGPRDPVKWRWFQGLGVTGGDASRHLGSECARFDATSKLAWWELPWPIRLGSCAKVVFSSQVYTAPHFANKRFMLQFEYIRIFFSPLIFFSCIFSSLSFWRRGTFVTYGVSCHLPRSSCFAKHPEESCESTRCNARGCSLVAQVANVGNCRAVMWGSQLVVTSSLLWMLEV